MKKKKQEVILTTIEGKRIKLPKPVKPQPHHSIVSMDHVALFRVMAGGHRVVLRAKNAEHAVELFNLKTNTSFNKVKVATFSYISIQMHVRYAKEYTKVDW